MDLIPPKLETFVKNGFTIQYTTIKGEVKYKTISEPVLSTTFISRYNNVTVTILNDNKVEIFDIEKNTSRKIKLPVVEDFNPGIRNILALDNHNNIICYNTFLGFYTYNIDEDKHIKIADADILRADVISDVVVAISSMDRIYIIRSGAMIEKIPLLRDQKPSLYPYGVIFYNNLNEIVIYNIERDNKTEIIHTKGFDHVFYLPEKQTFIASNGVSEIREYNLKGKFIRDVKRDTIDRYSLSLLAQKFWNYGNNVRILARKYGTSDIYLLPRPLEIQATEVRNFLSKSLRIPFTSKNIKNTIIKFLI